MKLGQQVKFNKCLVKSGDSASFGYLSERQERDLEEQGYFMQAKVVKKEIDTQKTGIIVGKRRIGVRNQLEVEDFDPVWGEPGEERLIVKHTFYRPVYLVACDLRGVYKVDEEDLEVTS